MKRACAYCSADLGDVPPLDDERVSHGMCQACIDHFVPQWKGMDFDTYLETLEAPVLVVEPSEGRVITANRKAEALLGKSKGTMTGVLGGDVMECVHARLPQGCGKTVHCAACTVRQTVRRTAATGQSLCRTPAFVDHETERTLLTLDTHLRDGVVELTIVEGERVPKPAED